MNPNAPIEEVAALARTADRAQECVKRMWRASAEMSATPTEVCSALTGMFCVILADMPDVHRRAVLNGIMGAIESQVFGKDALYLPISTTVDVLK